MSNAILTPEQKIRQRVAWFAEAERLGNVTLACERCGISRKTYCKPWMILREAYIHRPTVVIIL